MARSDPSTNPSSGAEPPPKAAAAAVCEECGSNPWKYRCPGCSLRSCSLPCVKSHKKRTECTGKRKVDAVLSISEFDDNLLLSDYNMLEEVKRLAESSHRIREDLGGNLGKNQLPCQLSMLRTAALYRGTRIWFLPKGMSRRENNQSRFSGRKQSIFWTIEWRFHSTSIVLTDHDVDEHVSLSTVIGKHLTPSPWNNQLRPFCNVELDDLKFFIKRNQKFPGSPFRRLNIRASLVKQLGKTIVLEYPVIHVFLPTHGCDFQVENWEPPASCELIPSLPRPTKKKDVVEDGEKSSPRIVHYINPAPLTKNRPLNDARSVAGVGSADDQMLRAGTEALTDFSCAKSASDVVEKGARCSKSDVNVIESLQSDTFHFDEELRDAYSDFIGEMNPDDFLCLNDGQDELGEPERGESSLYFGGEFLQDEELEEGEIAS